MKTKTGKRRILETALGAALGAAIAGPVGAVAGGVAANATASRVQDLGGHGRRKKRAKGADADPGAHADLRRILVPLDFSPFSMRAARFARKWAIRFRAEVCLLHVIEPVNSAVPFGAEMIALPPPAVHRREFTASLEKIARKEFSRVAKISIHLRHGTPHDEIVRAAVKLKADIIIIAMHGRSGLVHALIGSTAERVVRHAPCPVLVLR